MSALRHRLEYALFRLLRGSLALLPLRLATRVLGGLLWLAQEGFGWRKAETHRRIAQIFPQKNDADLRQIRRLALRNLASNVMELLRPERVSLLPCMAETLAAVQEARKAGRGVLLVIAHSGNWDLAGIVAARQHIPICFIARQQKNQRMYRELLRTREAGGGTVVDRDDPGLLRKLLGFLADNGVVAILIDIRSRQAGDIYRFLGHPAPLANGLGLLAAKSGAEVLPIFLGRDRQGQHEWKPFPARRLRPDDPKTARRDLLQSCLDDLSPEILRNPESYFWFNKRWVLEAH
jgi:KDO2-lipid IV(A) lauroyltransferase